MEQPRKWSWVEFTLGWINKQFLIWIFSTVLVFSSIWGLHSNEEIQSEKIQLALVIVWGVISFCLFFYKALSALIENGKLNVEAKASFGLSKDIKEASK